MMFSNVFQPVQHHPLGQYQQGAQGTHASQGCQAKGPWMRLSCLLICWSGQSIPVSSHLVLLRDSPSKLPTFWILLDWDLGEVEMCVHHFDCFFSGIKRSCHRPESNSQTWRNTNRSFMMTNTTPLTRDISYWKWNSSEVKEWQTWQTCRTFSPCQLFPRQLRMSS